MTATASPLEAALWLRADAAGWTLHSTRQEWATRLLRGRPAADAPRLLPSLYSLCGGAHGIAARHAVAAAQGVAPAAAAAPGERIAAPDGAAAQALRLDTLREHLRRLWLEAPRQAQPGPAQAPPPGVPAASGAAAAAAAAALAACPLMAAGDAPSTEVLAAGRRWVETHVLDAGVDEWLVAWAHDAPAFAARWAGSGGLWPARWLSAMRRHLGELRQPVQAVQAVKAVQAVNTAQPSQPAPTASEAPPAPVLQQLARSLRTSPAFALSPTLDGHPAETGCWTRAADPCAHAGSQAYAPLWMRHAARLAEVAHLAGPGGEHWLAQGALATGTREGLGWCEMARGLLVHWLALDEQGRIARYHVLAPTEWNFHPQGGAARLLTRLASAATAATSAAARVSEGAAAPPALDFAQTLAVAAAYDPCVALHIEPTAITPWQ
ncbi:MAG: nickel-dependent hydrogenase large subunit [Burkholderiales bacterium]|nr:nickel-dependent hydrogenase large subunit [Burkholderiales bacterium]